MKFFKHIKPFRLFTSYILYPKSYILGLIPILFLISYVLYPLSASAQYRLPQATHGTEVEAAVGDFYLNVSGFISPFASIVMTSNGVFYRAVVADEKGQFYFSDVLIRKGFSGFCLEAVDVKRLGTSTACFSFPAATGSITMRDILLPPTLGLQRTEIRAGGTAVIFGYGMPGAEILVKIDNGTQIKVIADSSGYYEVKVKNLPAGKYKITAEQRFRGKLSERSTKVLTLTALSWWQIFLNFLKTLWQRFWKLLTSIVIGPLWLLLPLIILIIILILKLWPERFTFIYNSKLLSFFTKKQEKRLLHHAWFVGY